jgi:hypothetical protein
MEYKEQILNAINEFRKTPFLIRHIKEYEPIEKENELVFFFKPELLSSESINFEKILEITFEKFAEFDINVESISVLGNEYLKKHGIIAEHYGVINKIAKHGKSELSSQALENFEKIFGESADKVEILGAFQFLEKFPEFNEFSLNVLWENLENKKLASGTYCEKIKVGEKYVYVLNGFHPYQLYHFTRPGAFIVVMAVSSDTDWKTLRQDFIGATNPHNAKEGSLRRILLEKKEELGIPVVSQGYNGVHLSAGPVEGLAELLRFCSDYESGRILSISDTMIGRKFLEAFPEETVRKLIENPKVEVDGKLAGVFDITEEMNTSQAIEILKKYF